MKGRDNSKVEQGIRAVAPRGFVAIGIFWFFGAAMASLAGTTLTWPGTFLDKLWALNPDAYKQLVPYGKLAGILFLTLGGALLITGAGWFKCRKWGWWMAVIMIATQIGGDLVNALQGNFLKGGTGAVVASALLFYLFRPRVKAFFSKS